MKKILFFFTFIALAFDLNAQYPIAPQNQQHTITGTVGECRSGRNRYHYGLDIDEINGTSVYAITDGIFRIVGTEAVTVGNFAYIHLNSIPNNIPNGTFVNAGDKLGEIHNTHPHVHLQQSTNVLNVNGFENPNDDWINPIGFLNPVDNVMPDIDACQIFTNGAIPVNLTNNGFIYDKIDILLNSEDPRILANGGNGAHGNAPYRMDFDMLNLDDSKIKEFDGVSFANVPPNASAHTVFGANSNFNTPNFEYYLTNDPFNTPFNKYWNTRQLKNGTYDKSANLPWETEFEDGKPFRIQVNSCDYSNNCNDITLPSTTGQYRIDNFKPFVESLEIYTQNGPLMPSGEPYPIYQMTWLSTTKGQIFPGLRFNKGEDSSTPGEIEVKAIFSESMEYAKVRIIDLMDWKEGTLSNSPLSGGRQEWRFNFDAPTTIDPNKCYKVEVDGGDLGGNQLLELVQPQCSVNPAKKTIPFRTGLTTWSDVLSPLNQGFDKAHSFKFGPCGVHKNESEDQFACISLDEVKIKIEYASVGHSDGAIRLTITGSHPSAIFIWTDINGVEISTNQNLTNVPKGIYCVEIKEDCCVLSGCFEIEDCTSDLQKEFVHPTVASPNTGEIHVSVEGGNEPYAYTWQEHIVSLSLLL